MQTLHPISCSPSIESQPVLDGPHGSVPKCHVVSLSVESPPNSRELCLVRCACVEHCNDPSPFWIATAMQTLHPISCSPSIESQPVLDGPHGSVPKCHVVSLSVESPPNSRELCLVRCDCVEHEHDNGRFLFWTEATVQTFLPTLHLKHFCRCSRTAAPFPLLRRQRGL